MESNKPAASERFPPPPAYYKSYGENGTIHPLAYSLDPPKIPTERYQCYGEEWELDEKEKTLKEEGCEQLFEVPENGSLDVATELQRISNLAINKYKKVLDGYIDMDCSMEDMDDTFQGLKDIYINLVYLVNQLRPAQGRQILIESLKKQTKERLEVSERLDKLVVNGEEKIKSLLASFNENIKSSSLEDEEVQAMESEETNTNSMNIYSIT